MKRLLLLLLLALPLAAQTRVVSRIDVRGGVPAKIVLSQAALVEGRSYTDRDIDNAVARVRRLPFVYDARHSFEGDTLVIEVNAMSRLFAEVDAQGDRFENNDSGFANVGGGGRLFLGSGGVVQGLVAQTFTDGDDATGGDLEYSHYGIGGTRLYASAGVSHSIVDGDNGSFEPDPTWRLSIGYPLTVRQTIDASVTDEGFRSRRNFLPDLPSRVSFADRQTLNLRWTYDTTEDPFFTRRGEVISAGPSWSNESSQFDSFGVIGPDGQLVIFTQRSEGSTASLVGNARKYFATGTRGAVFGGLDLSLQRSDIDSTFGLDGPMRNIEVNRDDVVVTAGYAHNLFDWGGAGDGLRHRVEAGVSYVRSHFEQEASPLFPFSSDATLDRYEVTTAYVLRRPYANVRLSLSFSGNIN